MENSSTGPEGGKLRPIRKKEQAFLTRELEHWRWLNLLDERQASAISALYEPAKERFLQVLMGLGAMLIGLGLLSYIAANWMDLGRTLKVALIVGGYLLSVMAAYWFEPHYPYTSRAFLLIGSFTYGGGIFLIAQIFHEGGAITDALFWWMAGIAPACLLFKDRMQLLLTQGIALVYFHWLYQAWWWLFDGYSPGYSLWITLRSLLSPYPLAVLVGLWLLWRRLDRGPTGERWSVGLHMNIFIVLNLFGIHASRYCRDAVILWLLFFAVGLFLCAAPLGRLKDSLEGWGITLTSVFGLVLSYPNVWRWSRLMVKTDFWGLENFCLHTLHTRPEAAFAVAAAILACAMLLWRIHKGSLLATSFFCLLILRYYFDLFYDFMDKALFFTIGGALLMTMGIYFQRASRKRGQAKLEKKAVQS